MSERDVLEEACAELRAVGGASDEAQSTRRKIVVDAVARRKRRRVVLLRVLVPLAATLLVTSAWAASTGRFARVRSFALSLLFEPSRGGADSPSADGRPVAAPRNTPTFADTTPVASLPAPSVPVNTPPVTISPLTAPAAPREAAPVSLSSSAPTTKPVTRSSAEAAADSTAEELRLYQVAHRAHFEEHDDEHALAAWDAYLAAHPRGRLAPEARYNRALNLMRLGRDREAREALHPFAEGAYGGYRQHEARDLLERIDEKR